MRNTPDELDAALEEGLRNGRLDRQIGQISLYAWHGISEKWRAGRRNPLPVTATFFARRRGLRPEVWITSKVSAKAYRAKSQFARGLLGYEDAACFDVHMTRAFPKLANKFSGTRWQWSIWLLKLYPAAHPAWDHSEVLRQHAQVLRWVRRGGRK